MIKNQKGFSSLLVIIAVLAIVGVFGLYLYNSSNNATIPGLDYELSNTPKDTKRMEDGEAMEKVEYETLEEDETTPEEINNEVLDELDALVQEIDNDTSLDDTLDF
jgi:hypothetical protein